MNNSSNSTPATMITVGDTVTFSHQARMVTGTVVRKERAYAQVVCDDQHGFRVPYALLTKVPGVASLPLQGLRSRSEQRRAAFHPGVRVQFVLRGTMVTGAVARVNPKRAHVLTDDGREYRVSYGLLQQVERNAAAATTRTAAEMEAIAGRARDLLAYHQLSQWSFQFDNGRKRAGCCQYGTQVISLSYDLARHASDEEIRETILHEIAHALVGKAHNHDEVWRAKAIEIGCSGERCHDLQFSPPRYIVKCERGCWVATAERRKRDVSCKQCRGFIVYETYTEERWLQARHAQPAYSIAET